LVTIVLFFAKINIDMEEFCLESFVAEPTLQVFNLLMKPQLVEVANYYKLSITGPSKKGDIKRLLTEYLIDEGLVPEDEDRSPTNVDSNFLELKRLELQECESAREAQLKMKELEIRERVVDSTANERTRSAIKSTSFSWNFRNKIV